jgi:hypothetical protein
MSSRRSPTSEIRPAANTRVERYGMAGFPSHPLGFIAATIPAARKDHADGVGKKP